VHHIAACLDCGGQHQKLLISGGVGGGVRYDDMWLLDPRSGEIEKVKMALEKGWHRA